jgi:hypothetical protein
MLEVRFTKSIHFDEHQKKKKKNGNNVMAHPFVTDNLIINYSEAISHAIGKLLQFIIA